MHMEGILAQEEDVQATVDSIIDAAKEKRGGLMVILNETQRAVGYLPKEIQTYIAKRTATPPSVVYGVVSFYSFFTMIPRGKHLVKVCMGTACYVKGAGKLLDDIANTLHIEVGQTTDDGLYTLESCRCLGVCSQAPAIMIDEDVIGKVSMKSFMDTLKHYQ
ncbi:NAD(P)H-dependent oxidoreductase subunit E [candidate division KSB3 bacterium]|uniref:NAD(P)H-dependent oxidoreductase subunit E n=1 Tax=candidate division KSB3 bacterium TaxID=2044937 RepID=A0A9D5Q602_9BACT|nr:NAD(P)H-dependent oxidoreductase subunit E [candidate division KSB3 bacterium]MBD3324898.1 NAD(P)H-dependent oxidoreductase subunit E [candidate division KSB3 bacterium]